RRACSAATRTAPGVLRRIGRSDGPLERVDDVVKRPATGRLLASLTVSCEPATMPAGPLRRIALAVVIFAAALAAPGRAQAEPSVRVPRSAADRPGTSALVVFGASARPDGAPGPRL